MTALAEPWQHPRLLLIDDEVAVRGDPGYDVTTSVFPRIRRLSPGTFGELEIVVPC